MDTCVRRVYDVRMPPEHFGTERKPATPWLNTAEAAAYARTSKERLYEAIANGQLKAVKPIFGVEVSDVLPALRRDTRGQESVPIATVGMREHPEAQQPLHNVPSGRDGSPGPHGGVRNASSAATGRLLKRS